MKKIIPDIIVMLRLLTSEQGGREKEIKPIQFGCPFIYKNEAFDCRLLLDIIGETLFPGSIKQVPIKFLFPEHIKPRLKTGDVFELWDMRIFAVGEVLKILD